MREHNMLTTLLKETSVWAYRLAEGLLTWGPVKILFAFS